MEKYLEDIRKSLGIKKNIVFLVQNHFYLILIRKKNILLMEMDTPIPQKIMTVKLVLEIEIILNFVFIIII